MGVRRLQELSHSTPVISGPRVTESLARRSIVMGLFQRLHRITIGRIEAFLDRVEDPELVLPGSRQRDGRAIARRRAS